MLFGPDGNLYVANAFNGGATSEILRYNGHTGAFLDAFVPSGSGGLLSPLGLVFGPDGHLYVSSQQTHQILEYDGQTGAFLHAHIKSGQGGLRDPAGLVFGPDGNLYVSSYGSGQVLRYDGTTGVFLGVSASGVFARYLTFRPVRCDVITQDTYLSGQAVTVGIHVANGLPAALPIEGKLWLYTPNGVRSISSREPPQGHCHWATTRRRRGRFV
jgi:glucose/arabinose dehydrogenase